MSDAREELIQLINRLPDETVVTLLATARALSKPNPQHDQTWPPAFFGSIEGAANGRTDNASGIDEFLAESGFGRDSEE